MIRYVKTGFASTLQQPFAVIALFLYQFAWGIALYKLIQSVVVPLMHRFPGSGQPKLAAQLFLAEGQFQLFKTDLSHSYLWWIAALLGARMLLTPVLNAGIYYSLARPELHAGYRFCKGIADFTLPFLLCYVIQIALTLLPLAWLWPKAQAILAHSLSYEAAFQDMLPWLLGLLAHGFVLRLLFMHIQFSLVRGARTLPALLTFAGSLLPILGAALLLLLGSLALTGAAVTAVYLWAGLIALIFYQLLPLFNMFLQIWTIASQYQIWSAKMNA